MARRKRHSPEEVVCKLQEVDRLLNVGKSLVHVCQALEISEATYHPWRNRHGGIAELECSGCGFRIARRLPPNLQELFADPFQNEMQ